MSFEKPNIEIAPEYKEDVEMIKNRILSLLDTTIGSVEDLLDKTLKEKHALQGTFSVEEIQRIPALKEIREKVEADDLTAVESFLNEEFARLNKIKEKHKLGDEEEERLAEIESLLEKIGA